MIPRVLLATIVLNEAEFIESCVKQHEGWPGRIGHVVVEGAARSYGAANPAAVSAEGLSVDGTASILATLPVTHIQHGWADGPPLQQKRALRNRYCAVADEEAPDLLVVIDADEFYTVADQERISLIAGEMDHDAWLFRQRHLWKPATELWKRGPLEVVGGYWSVPHVRVWRWERGARYVDNHNYLRFPGREGFKLRRPPHGAPECVHYGFARSPGHRKRTNRYYVARGEGKERGFNRSMYVDCRAAFERWRHGDPLPHGARVVPYDGPLPEVMARGRLS